MRVRLETFTGELVTDQVALPAPFRQLPGVVTWGLRTFVLQPTGLATSDGPVPVYREAFACAVLDLPPPAPEEPRLLCPRREEVGGGGVFRLPRGDTWHDDHTCSYCGSLDPDWLMPRLEAGTVELGPTDKDYKAYVENAGGEEIKVRGAAKVYFQHFSVAQRKRFVELLNAKQLKIGMPGRFYVLPFFIQRAAPASEVAEEPTP